MRVVLAEIAVWYLLSAPAAASSILGGPYVNERLHLRLQPPNGWHLVHDGRTDDEPVEFWKEGEYGPRIQALSFVYALGSESNVEELQKELSRALLRQFPNLDIVKERQLTYRGGPAIEVMATLQVEDTYYHVIQRCLFARGRIYIITCASFESSFLADLPVFQASLDSVEILGPIYDPDALGTRRGHLIRPTTMGWLALGFTLLGLLLRRVSRAKLERMRG